MLDRNLTDPQIQALFVWVHAMNARMDKAEICLSNRS